MPESLALRKKQAKQGYGLGRNPVALMYSMIITSRSSARLVKCLEILLSKPIQAGACAICLNLFGLSIYL